MYVVHGAVKPLTNMFRVFYTSTHFGRVVWPWEFVLCPSQWATAGVEDLEALVNFKRDLVHRYLPSDGKTGAPALQNYYEISGPDSLCLVSLQVVVSWEQRPRHIDLLAYDTSATLSLL